MTRFTITNFLFCLGLMFFALQGSAAESAELEEIPPSSSHSVRVLLIPRMQTVLSGEISARIEKIAVDFGDHFDKNELLVSFNCSRFEAELEKSLALQREAEKTLEVSARLKGLGSISELEAAVAHTRLDQAKAEAAIKQLQVSGCSIKAPFSGSVVKRLADPYQYITTGQPVLEIIDNSSIDIQIHIPSNWLTKINTSTKFTVFIDEVEKQYEAIVTTFGSRIDPVSQTLEIRGTIDGNHPELLAGMSGTAFFTLP